MGQHNSREQYVLKQASYLLEYGFKQNPHSVANNLGKGLFETVEKSLQQQGMDIYKAIADMDQSCRLNLVYNDLFDEYDLLHGHKTLNEEKLMEILGARLENNQIICPPEKEYLLTNFRIKGLIDSFVQRNNIDRTEMSDIELVRLEGFGWSINNCKEARKWSGITWTNFLIRLVTYEDGTLYINEYGRLIFNEIDKHLDLPLLKKILSVSKDKPNTTLQVR